VIDEDVADKSLRGLLNYKDMCICYVTTGQRPQFVTQATQQAQIRPVEPQFMAPPQGSVLVRSSPASFAPPQPQRMPVHQVSSLPQQPSPQVMTVAGPSMSFPAQTAPPSHVYTGVPVGHGFAAQQPHVFGTGQTNFPSQNFVGQQPGVNIVRPLAAASVQPLYRNVEPLAPQQPSNQTPFMLPQPSNQSLIFQQMPGGERPPLFDGNVFRTPLSLPSSIPGYTDFSGDQMLFKTGFSSDPEIVGQPIETVIHDRERDSRLGNGRATLGFEQNRAKNFPGIE